MIASSSETMDVSREAAARPAVSPSQRIVLNIGSGPISANRLHQAFRSDQWREIRLDIDPEAEPDVIGSITAMGNLIPHASVDAIWCSHSLEHLYGHEVVPALEECCRILKPDGFALVTSPDLTAIVGIILREGLDTIAYVSPGGPITPLDMMFGHGDSISKGNTFMAHKTGFTVDRLGKLATAAGFPEARVISGDAFDIWAILMMPEASAQTVLPLFAGTNVGSMFS